MITRRLSVVATAFCCLLAVATSASAECAWVLWQSDPTPSPTLPGYVIPHYKLIEAFTGGLMTSMNDVMAQKKCEERKTQMVTALPKKSTTEYLCTPDTVDPRGPKGK